MSTDNPIASREFLDPVFKEVMTFNFAQLALPFETQVEVSRLPRTMDALVVLEKATEREKAHAQTVFSYFRVYNQIEFKSKADPLTRDGYNLIRGRSYLYLGEKKISASLMTVTIISARQPRNVLYHSPPDVKWESEGKGHYKSTDIFPVNLFVCNELEIESKNYPLLLFAASKEKFRQFVEQIIGENNIAYIYYASRVEPQITKEVLQMAGKQNLYEKQLQRIVDSMGTDLLKKMTPEERVRGLTVAERLTGLNLEDLRALDAKSKAELLQLLKLPDETQD